MGNLGWVENDLRVETLEWWILNEVSNDDEIGIEGSRNVQPPKGQTTCGYDELFVRAAAVAEIFEPLVLALGLMKMNEYSGRAHKRLGYAEESVEVRESGDEF